MENECVLGEMYFQIVDQRLAHSAGTETHNIYLLYLSNDWHHRNVRSVWGKVFSWLDRSQPGQDILPPRNLIFRTSTG